MGVNRDWIFVYELTSMPLLHLLEKLGGVLLKTNFLKALIFCVYGF